MTRVSAAFAIVLCLALPALPASAQPDQGPSLESLHNALRLRPDQEPAWRAFAQASSPDPQDEARHDDAFRRMETMRSPDRMDMSIQLMQSDLNAMQRRAAALRSFYSSLTPQQQAAFDRQTAPPRQ
jgi:hypothetical protein